jgi:hypothetical protein
MDDNKTNKAATYTLVGITILVVIIGTVALILVLTVFRPKPNVGGVPCSDIADDLISITGTPCYFNSQGFCSLTRYSTEILGGTYLYTTPTNYTVVCNPLCVGYLNSDWECCADGDDICAQNKINYDNCVNTTKPNQCNGEAMPVAIDGNILYYAGQVSSVQPARSCDCSTIGT